MVFRSGERGRGGGREREGGRGKTEGKEREELMLELHVAQLPFYCYCFVNPSPFLLVMVTLSLPPSLQDGVFIEAENTRYLDSGAVQDLEGDHIPDLEASISGANYFDRDTQTLHLVRRIEGEKEGTGEEGEGATAHLITSPPSLQPPSTIQIGRASCRERG